MNEEIFSLHPTANKERRYGGCWMARNGTRHLASRSRRDLTPLRRRMKDGRYGHPHWLPPPPGRLYSSPSPCMLRACLSNFGCPVAVPAAVGTGQWALKGKCSRRGQGFRLRKFGRNTGSGLAHQPPVAKAREQGMAAERTQLAFAGGVGEHRGARRNANSPSEPKHPMAPSKGASSAG